MIGEMLVSNKLERIYKNTTFQKSGAKLLQSVVWIHLTTFQKSGEKLLQSVVWLHLF